MYILNPEMTVCKLQKYGFSRVMTLKKPVYKNSIILRIHIENNENGKPAFEFNVWDSGKSQLYYPFYYSEFGRDSVLDTVKKNVRKELKRLLRDEILLEDKDEKNC